MNERNQTARKKRQKKARIEEGRKKEQNKKINMIELRS